jgi:hypothetical protein
LGWVVVETRVPDDKVVERFELDGRGDDGERRISGCSPSMVSITR